MSEKGFKRKLTAMLSADVVGYSRLMRDNEEATVRDIAAHRVLITEIIQQHHGRVVDSPGDNILAEFISVVDAVNGAIKIQDEIKKSNADTPEDRQMVFRIGINLGDVIEEKDRIYGDGVNIAARVEGLAEAGGISISGTVYEHIKDKLSLGYHFLGEQNVKNIPEPVRVYRLLTKPEDAGKLIGGDKSKSKKFRHAALSALALIIFTVCALVIWNNYFRVKIEPAAVDKMAFPLPDKPSIAVLPFDNMSGDPSQEYFSDGLTEEIITSLAKVPSLFVIARNSSFTYKGKPVKVQQVSEELGVRYVLEGSVRKSENQLRITAQLIDAIAGNHLWAERYDRKLEDLFNIEDEITKKIITALQVTLTEGEQIIVYGKGTRNLDAYLKYLQTREQFLKFDKDGVIRAQKMAQETIDLDPKYANGYALLAWTNLFDVWFGITKSPEKSYQNAIMLANKAISLDNSLPTPYSLLSHAYTLMRQYEKAISAGERAVELEPNSADANAHLGQTLNYADKPREAIQLLEKAIRLNPYPPSWYLHNLGGAFIGSGRYGEAVEVLKKAIDRQPKDQFAHLGLAIAYILAGHKDKAVIEAKEVIRINPNFTLKYFEKTAPYKSKESLKLRTDALREAGF